MSGPTTAESIRDGAALIAAVVRMDRAGAVTDLPSFSAIISPGREVPTETFEVDGRLQRHIEGCACTTLHMRWPCEDVTP